ncbi:MAG: magnesium and cobalt transport protein CorA [Betaproteobacteria bacterium RIFCSPHIGHO2_12_FULL_69_13]|nr:MAG: magnesium and cobalt transport protein CorA [Betaproteobacteria bacterium RIFCSPHIGHO2_12_FULL_69_13]OGA70327.1 MAG: magnesium and cobalt transport protein CorA [Betaproteobacteria bacterium RIFCSPLOWO2_12_FULL_68_20]
MLVNRVAYEEGRKLADIEQGEIRGYLARPGCFVWVALRDASAAELADMQREFDLHPLAVEDAQHGHQRPKIEEYGDSLFVAMHIVEPGEELKVGEMAIFVGRNYVLSVRQHAERAFTDVRARCEREPELLRHGSGYVLYALMDAVVDRYFPVLDTLEMELETIEEKIFAAKSARAIIESLYYVKQKLTVLKHATAPLLEACGRLHGGRVPQVCAGLGDYFRDVYDHLVRLNQSIDSERDTVATAIQVNLALITVGENEVTKRLAAYAALVAVPTMIAGVYGMNFELMPELRWAYGYPFAVGLMFAIDAYLFHRFRKAGWL